MKVWVLHRFENYGDVDYIRLYATRELTMAAVMADIDRYWTQDWPDEPEAVKLKAREAMDRENAWWPRSWEGYKITEEIVHEEPQQ